MYFFLNILEIINLEIHLPREVLFKKNNYIDFFKKVIENYDNIYIEKSCFLEYLEFLLEIYLINLKIKCFNKIVYFFNVNISNKFFLALLENAIIFIFIIIDIKFLIIKLIKNLII